MGMRAVSRQRLPMKKAKVNEEPGRAEAITRTDTVHV
jgi:hypothetical protein